MRIVSLVPSLTKTLFDLGLGDSVVGCTSFCVDPPKETKKIRKIGGTKNPNINAIKELRPTHILVNSEENRLEDVNHLRQMASVLETFPKDIVMVPTMLRNLAVFLGDDFGFSKNCQKVAIQIDDLVAKLQEQKQPESNDYLYFIWRNPLMCAGHETYIESLFRLIGFRNAVKRGIRYPEITWEEIDQLRPRFIFLSSEPFPFRKRHAQEILHKINYRPFIVKVDGRMFSWHGSLSLGALRHLDSGMSGAQWWEESLMA